MFTCPNSPPISRKWIGRLNSPLPAGMSQPHRSNRGNRERNGGHRHDRDPPERRRASPDRCACVRGDKCATVAPRCIFTSVLSGVSDASAGPPLDPHTTPGKQTLPPDMRGAPLGRSTRNPNAATCAPGEVSPARRQPAEGALLSAGLVDQSDPFSRADLRLSACAYEPLRSALTSRLDSRWRSEILKIKTT